MNRLTLHSIFLFGLFLSFQLCFAQVPITIQGVPSRIEYGTAVIMDGDYTHQDEYDARGDTTYAFTIWNFSQLYITGNITNQSQSAIFDEINIKDYEQESEASINSFIQSMEDRGVDVSGASSKEEKIQLIDDYFTSLGEVILQHPSDSQTINGDVYFPNLTIDKALDKKVIVNDGQLVIENILNLKNGKLAVNNGNIQLGFMDPLGRENNRTGIIENEGHQHYIELDDKSFIATQRFITADEANDFGNIGISFTPSEEANYTIYRWQQSLASAGDGSVPRYYRIATDNPAQPIHAKDITLNFLEHETQTFPKDELALWYSEDNGTNFRNSYHANLTLNNGGNQQHIVTSDSVHFSTRKNNTNLLTIGKFECDDNLAVNLGDSIQYLCGNDDSLYLHPQLALSGMEYAWEKIGATDLLVNETYDSLLIKTIGQYAIEITNNKGCKGFDTVEVRQVEKPLASFDVNNPLNQLCLGDSFSYVNTSTDPNPSDAGLPLSYQWNFSDPFYEADSSLARDTTYPYQRTGIYQTDLTVTNNFGCVDQDTLDNLFVYPVPTVNFDIPDICEGSEVTFTNQSSLTPTKMVDYTNSGSEFNVNLLSTARKWIIYNADSIKIDSATTENLNYIFADTGKYYVGLSESNPINCVINKVQEVKVHEIPMIDFTATEACAGQAVTLSVINNSNYPTENLNLTWEIQEVADPLTGLTPSWIPQFAGDKLVKVDVQVGACSYEYSKNITIKPLPEPILVTKGKHCFGENIDFINLTTYGEGEEPDDVVYTWDFGDGTTATTKNASHSFTAPTGPAENRKTYTITLSANTLLCGTSIDTTITISRSPSALFTLVDDTICIGTEAIVNASGTFLTGDGFVWDFGDGKGKVFDRTAVNRLFDVAGTYTITFQTFTEEGCDTNTYTQTLVVEDIPAIKLADNLSVCGDSTRLDVSSGQAGMSYLWSTGETTPDKLVTADGYYTVTLTSDQGCSATKGVNVSLSESGTRFITETVDSCGQTILTSSVADASYSWSTGETTNQITVNTSGIYTVISSVPGSCEITTAFAVNIYEYPDLSVIPDLQTSCEADGAVIFDAQNNGATDYLWKNLTTGTTSSNRQISLTDPGIYDYNIRMTNDNRCTLNKNVRAEIYQQPTLDLGPDQNVCDETTLIANGNFTDYLWSIGETNSFITVNTAGEYRVEVTNNRGCTTSDTIEIFTPAKPSVDLGSDQFVCVGTNVTLDAGNVGNSYFWSTGATSQQITVNSSGDYYVTVQSPEGCLGRDTVRVDIADPIIVDLGRDRFICDGSNQALSTSYSGFNHVWESSLGGVISTDESIAVNQSDKYWVTVSNNIGCSGSDTVRLTYTNIPLKAEFLASSEATVGDIVQFVNVSYDNIQTNNWSFGDNSTSEEENPRHRYTDTGSYSITLSVDNGLCTDSYSKAISILPVETDTATSDTNSSRFEALVDIKKATAFPNPTENNFILEVELSREATIYANLMNLSGKVLAQDQATTDLYTKEFDLSNLPVGTFLMQVIVGGKQLRTLRIIKQ